MGIESQYIKDLKNGSRKAFNALYEIYSSRLYGYCYQWTKSHEDAEEIVQDVFVKLWIHRDSIENEETILYFVFKIAKNQLINMYRSNVNSAIYEEYLQYSNTSSLSIDDTAYAVEYDDFCKLLNKIKETLPETQQKVYEYSKLRHFSNQEIADALGLSEQTVKNQLSLALKVFRENLSRYNLILPIVIFYILVKK